MLIRFMNNDDWVYYKMVQNFLQGNFNLDQISAPTFYSQGLLAYVFSKFFGIQNLPNLTLIISLLSLIIFFYILKKFYKNTIFSSILFTLFLAFNPYFAYSSIGFMTENYFLFYILITLLFFNFYNLKNKKKYLILTFFFIFIGFMLRQVMLVFILSMFVFYLLQKKYKLSLLSLGYFVTLYSFYNYIFPKTTEMYEKSLQFHHLLDFDYSFSLIYSSFIVIVALLLPLFVNFIIFSYQKKYNISHKLSFRILHLIKNKKDITNFLSKLIKNKNTYFIFFNILISAILYYYFNALHKPQTVSWGEFPYLENTWERFGLYPRGIEGTKYQFWFNYDLYTYWDLFSKILVSIFLVTIILVIKKRKLIDFNFIFIALYMGLMILTETFYDRYLLVPIVFSILFLVKNFTPTLLSKTISISFSLFLIFYTYNFVLDFVIINNFVQDTSNELITKNNVDPTQIHANNAYKLNNRNYSKSYDYRFSYDSIEVNEGYRNDYELIKEFTVEYPFNFFINPNIYLYKRL